MIAATEGLYDLEDESEGGAVKPGYRLILVDKDGAGVGIPANRGRPGCPVDVVAALKQSIEDVEDEEP